MNKFLTSLGGYFSSVYYQIQAIVSQNSLFVICEKVYTDVFLIVSITTTYYVNTFIMLTVVDFSYSTLSLPSKYN